MSFGKRQAGVGAGAQALNVNMPAAQGEAAAEPAQATGGPIRWLVMLLASCGLLYGLFTSYGPDLVRDHRLSGTWQPAYDLRATEGKCKRTNFVVTLCSAKIRSVAQPDQAPIDHGFYMLFSSGDGEALVPVRSTADRAAVSIFYAAETKLWNRTVSFVLTAGFLVLLAFVSLLLFRRALYS